MMEIYQAVIERSDEETFTLERHSGTRQRLDFEEDRIG